MTTRRTTASAALGPPSAMWPMVSDQACLPMALLWRAGVHTFGLASPVVSDGIVFVGSTDGNLYAFSVNGMAPAKRLPGGELGIRPALSSLRPDGSLRASRTPRLG